MDKMLVKNIMKEEVVVAGHQHTFSQVLEFFNLYKIRHLPVTENDKLIGIISVRDVLRILFDKLSTGESVKLQEIDEAYNAVTMMTPSPITVSPESTLEEALALMSGGDFHALPVTENDILKGIVSQHDLVTAYYKERHPTAAHYEISTPGFGV